MTVTLPFPIESGHATLQHGFAEAIFLTDRPIPATIRDASCTASTSRFGVYRNNVIFGLINALAARYPVTRKLLWPDTFAQIARMYIATEPPRSPILLAYGDGFPQFLRQLGEGASADYIADIAEIESARTNAYHAADASPVGRDAFTALGPDELPNARLKLHPSVSLLKSRFPVVSLWEANCRARDSVIRLWQPETALVARPRLEVVVWRLGSGAYEFFTAIEDGCTVSSALSRTLEVAPDFDLAESISILIASEVVVGIERDAP